MSKPKLAVYWATSCGGCDVSILDIDEKILDVAANFELCLWPCAADFKYDYVESLPDKSITVCLFNGGIRNAEQEEIAHMLRRKTQVMVAFGSCAHLGGIPGLSNLVGKEKSFERAYITSPSTHNPDRVFPKEKTQMPEGELGLPRFYEMVFPLDQIIDVEYYLPGCPPPPKNVAAAVEAIIKGELPPVGSVIAPNIALCDECERERDEDRKITELKWPWEIIPDPKQCFLDQGIVCCGPATRAGCGSQCINANMPCRGCFGPTDEVQDQGAKLAGAIASIMEYDDPEEIKKALEPLLDPIGTFNRFSLPASLLKGKLDVVRKEKEIRETEIEAEA